MLWFLQPSIDWSWYENNRWSDSFKISIHVAHKALPEVKMINLNPEQNMIFQVQKRLILTTELGGLIILPPCIDSGFEWAIGVTGKDDVLVVRSVKSFVRDNVLEMNGFCFVVSDEPPCASMAAAFSISKVLFRYLKLNFGSKLLMFDLIFDDEGSGGSFIWAKLGLGIGEKITLLGVELGIGGVWIVTKSNLASSRLFDCISKLSSRCLWCCPSGLSSVISVDLPT